jgi:hypothetical protein
MAIALGLGLACALGACGGGDEAKEATEVTVESAQQPGAPTGQAAKEDTEATVESAEPEEEPAEQ